MRKSLSSSHSTQESEKLKLTLFPSSAVVIDDEPSSSWSSKSLLSSASAHKKWSSLST